MSRRVPFFGGRYEWEVCSGIVYNKDGLVVVRNCTTLNQARKAVESWQNRNKKTT